MSHDIFRYVPQIEQTGLQVDPRVMALLLERDRQLEDYLSNLHPGEGGAAVLGHFALGKNTGAAPNALSPANGWTLVSSYGSGVEVVAPGNFCFINAAGLWAVGAGVVTQGQFADYFLEMHRYANGASVLGDETIERSTNRRQVIGWHFNLMFSKAPEVLNSQTIDFRLFHTWADGSLGGTVFMTLTRFALPT